MSARVHMTADTLNQLLPKNPNEPGLVQEEAYVPRSIKVKFNRLADAMSDPTSGLTNPYPELIQVLEQTQPETLNYVRQQIISRLQNADDVKELTNAQARKISIIMGMPVRHETSPEFLARLQQTAKLMPQGQQQGSRRPGKVSNKISHQAATMDAPSSLQNSTEE